MGTITLPNVLSNHVVSDANQVNSNFNTIYNEFNGNVDNNNIKSGAAIALSKIAGFARLPWMPASAFVAGSLATDADGTDIALSTNQADHTADAARHADYIVPSHVQISNMGILVWDFSGASSDTNYIYSTLFMPTGGTSKAYSMKLYWTNTATGSGNVVWKFVSWAPSDGAAIARASLTDVIAFDAKAANQNALIISTTSSTWTPTSGSMHFIGVYRDAGNASDTYANDARFIGLALY